VQLIKNEQLQSPLTMDELLALRKALSAITGEGCE
jgi:hypothetical protein